MFKIIGETLSLPTKIVQQASNQIADNHKYAVDCVKGRKNEALVYSILKYLDAEVYLAPTMTALDVGLKADLIVEVGDVSYLWQIKSSMSGVKKHFSRMAFLTVNKSQREYPLCACILVSDVGGNKLALLKYVSEACGCGLTSLTEEALNLHKQMKGQKLPMNLVRKYYNILLTLGLISVDKGFVTFI